MYLTADTAQFYRFLTGPTANYRTVYRGLFKDFTPYFLAPKFEHSRLAQDSQTPRSFFASVGLMLTPRHFQKDLKFFHLNSGLCDRTWRTISLEERWRIFCQALIDIQFKTDFTAHAFVLMGTHFHILFSTRSEKKHLLADEFHQHLTQLCNQTWEALETPLFCDPIISAEYYKNAYKYIYRNPLEASLCHRVEDYEYSSLKSLIGGKPEMAPVIDNMGLIHSPRRVLAWLNDEGAQLKPKFREVKDLCR